MSLSQAIATCRSSTPISPSIYVGWDELHPGGWDPVARLTEQDRDEVLAEQTAHLADDVRDDIIWRNWASLYGLETS